MTSKRRLLQGLACLLLMLPINGCVASRAVVIDDDVPLRLAEPVQAKVAYNAAPAGQPENWVVLPNKVTLPAGKYVISRKIPGTTRPVGE